MDGSNNTAAIYKTNMRKSTKLRIFSEKVLEVTNLLTVAIIFSFSFKSRAELLFRMVAAAVLWFILYMVVHFTTKGKNVH